jgi:hypothetical protein
MEIKPWKKQTPGDQKSALGWKSVDTLGKDIHDMQTALAEEDMAPEMVEANKAIIKADKTMQQALVHTISEVSAN